MYFIQHCFVCRPSDSTPCRRMLGSNPGTVMTFFWHWHSDAATTRLNLIHLYYCYSIVLPTRSCTTPPGNVLQSKITICFDIHAWPVTYFSFFMNDIQHCFICRPSDSTVSEDAGIEPKTVAATALTVRRSNRSSRSHPQLITYVFADFFFHGLVYLII
jgi:hypothetical protein